MATWAIRLQRDIKEFAKEPLQGIHISLDEKNMQEMCLILSPLTGPFAGYRLHFTVRIPSEYPHKPPEVKINTVVPHPNVFDGGFICCSILRSKSDSHDGSPVYTPGYLLKYVFLQLLSFFSSDKVEQDYGGNVALQAHVQQTNRWDRWGRSYYPQHSQTWQSKIMAFTCDKCGFNKSFSGMADPQERILRVRDDTTPLPPGVDHPCEHSNPQAPSLLDKLDVDSLLEIADRLSDQDVICLQQAYDSMRSLLDKQLNVVLRRELNCFFYRMSFTEAILGVGVDSCVDNRNKPFVASFDLLSYQAFNDKVREGVTFERFKYFLPLALDDNHFQRGKALIKQLLQGMSQWCSTGLDLKLVSSNPGLAAMPVLSAILNTMVLRLVRSCDDFQARRDPFSNAMQKASEKALQGYCLVFHLFSKLVRSDEALAREIQQRVNRFIGDKKKRSKADVPDLGEFLTYLLVAEKLDWPSFCEIFLEELLARNVFWNLRAQPHLAFMEPENFLSEVRLKHTFQAAAVSLKLVMFQVSFLNMTRSREAEFDGRYGHPSSEMNSELLRVIREIYQVKDWDVFFRIVGFPLKETGWKWQVLDMLRAAVKLSEERGYHRNPYSAVELYALRRIHGEGCPAPEGWRKEMAGMVPPARNFSSSSSANTGRNSYSNQSYSSSSSRRSHYSSGSKRSYSTYDDRYDGYDRYDHHRGYRY